MDIIYNPPRVRSIPYSQSINADNVPLGTPIINRPLIVCLCGSTKFSREYQAANLRETLAGNIVLTIGCDMRTDAQLFEGLTAEKRAEIKAQLDELHFGKIALADEILVLNVGGYFGESTAREILEAARLGKSIRYLEPDKMPDMEHLRMKVESNGQKETR